MSDDAEELNQSGNALRQLGRYEEALASYDLALALRPDYEAALYNRSNVLLELHRPDEALASIERVLAIEPDDAEALTVRGNALVDLRRLEDALASYDRALALKPDDVPAFYARGNVLVHLHRHDEALASYARALDIDPDCVVARYNDSLCRLLVGDFATGWRQHEWRVRNEELKSDRRNFAQPLWLGEPAIAGKTILLHAEQGLGDTIQFCRYAKLVAAQGARVVLEVQAPLRPLLVQMEGVNQVLVRGETLPGFDYQCPLLSLPLAFHTGIDNIPADVPYLRSDPDRVRQWEVCLGASVLPRVGLTWSGRPAHGNDFNRSIALADFVGLVSPHAQFVSLQKDLRAGNAVIIERTGIKHFGDELQDFADTAALVELMDIIITVDTSVAHLAAAMGKTVWILLPFNPDWRWLLDRDDSPWYPTARLFRQPALGAWGSVIESVSAQLGEYLRRRS